MQSLVYPMAGLVALQFIVLFTMLILRIKAVRTRKLSPRYFKLNRGGEVPEVLAAVTQCYNNLLELPVLFYTVCLLAIVLNKVNEYLVILAWSYIVTRYIHAIILTTYNHILHRLLVFAISCVILIMMWVNLVIML